MIRCDAVTTIPTLLNRLGAWRDHEAWIDSVSGHQDKLIGLASQRPPPK